jgi:prepilin-type N-terminal cleavage/methylation domain-containing protein
MKKEVAGYTLVELVVVIGIFSVVMTLISVSFNRVVASSGQIVKSAETDIGGLIGLELLRIDLGLAGFGLPWSLPANVEYTEAQEKNIDGNNAASVEFNDAPRNPPRAFAMTDGKGFNGSDYLVLKGTALGMTGPSRRWSYLNYSSTGVSLKTSKSEVELTGKDENVIVISSGVRGGRQYRELVADSANKFGAAFDNLKPPQLPLAFQPKSRQDSYLVYGVTDIDTILFPFNRADYYLTSPDGGISPNCAHRDKDHGAGTLYRGMINQGDKAGGSMSPWPILDCVADFQVVFLNGDGPDGIITDINFPGDPDKAAQIREQVKEVRVFILVQQGRKDPGYSYPGEELVVGDKSKGWGKVWTQAELGSKLGDDWRHYRWKVYTIAVQTKNLD